jgi:hypothetical protein
VRFLASISVEFCFLAKRFLGNFACDLDFLQLAGQAAHIFTRQKLHFVIPRTEDHASLVHERLFLQLVVAISVQANRDLMTQALPAWRLSIVPQPC